MAFIQEFPLSVIEKLDYYVYLLIDSENKQVFYVGKGTGNRIFAHINAALTDALPSDKLDKIRMIRASGLEVT
ncbi:MAG: GIY-YIG nuclease family protein, partial [Acidobacteriota bacterium]|nr:GIY-YIG nuclease family protein [Acidobacteriota bacterium]